jgi:pyrimidine-nucleoside phosphorylase
MAEAAIASGKAFDKFRALVIAQGGDVSFVNNPQKFPGTKFVEAVNASRSGYLSRVNARIIGEAAVRLGAGREKKGDEVDHAVGFILHRKVGDYVEKDQPLITIYANNESKQLEVGASIRTAFAWSDQTVPPLPLFYE